MQVTSRRIPLINPIVFGALVILAILIMGRFYVLTTPSTTTSLTFQATQELVITPSINKPVPQVKAQAKPIAITQTAPPTSLLPLPLIPPTILSQTLPVYPASALANRIEGVVKLNLLVSETGRVKKVQISSSSGNAEIDQAAKAAVAEWIFAPAKRGVQAIKVWFSIPVRFAIHQ